MKKKISLKITFLMVLIFVCLQTLDYAFTYIGVCHYGIIEGNQYFIDLTYRYGYLLACLINLSAVAGLMLSLLLISRGLKTALYCYIIIGIFFFGLPILVIVNNFLIFRQIYGISGILNSTFKEVVIKTPETFNRTQFCTIVKYLS